ncbi:MAG: hypothetical protein HRF50_13915 [Phycisphaerae bacterium]|jgi:hypothetical protein
MESQPSIAAFSEGTYCPDCGYDLRGSSTARCPECGLGLEFIEGDIPLLPWARRREIGRLRAYWRTWLLVSVRRKRFYRALLQPLSHADAQRFRYVTLLHALVPFVLVLPAWAYAHPPTFRAMTGEFGWWFPIPWLVGLAAALVVLTGVPAGFLRPRGASVRQQNRAIALCRYACAPLALVPIPFILFIFVLLPRISVPARNTLTSLAVAVAVLLVGSWLVALREIAWRLTHSQRKMWLVTLVAPALATFLGFLALIVPPLVAAWLAVVFYSLR